MRKWLIILSHNYKGEIARTEPYSEERGRGDYLGKQSRQRGDPLKAGVAVVGQRV